MKRFLFAAAAVGALGVSAPFANAQMTGGPVSLSAPGAVNVDGAFGGGSSTMNTFNFGVAGNGTATGAGPAVTNDTGGQNPTLITPSIAVGTGLGSLMGMPADVYGRFSYQNITQQLQMSPNPNGTFVPTVSGLPSGGAFGSFLTVESGNLAVQRKQNLYDFESGVRVQANVGPFVLRPTAFLAYDHLDQTDNVTSIGAFDVFGWRQSANIKANYYRFGIRANADLPLGIPGVTWINYGSASLDVVHSSFGATQSYFCSTCAFGAPPNSASGSKTGLGTHLSAYTGFKHDESPNFGEFLIAGAQYISNTPYVVYPGLASGAVLGAGSGVANATGPAHIASTGQINYGLMIGLSVKFGGASPPPPTPVVAAPPPPPPAAAAPAKRMFIVFFEFDKSSLTPDGQKVVDAAAAAYKTGKSDIAIAGYTDLSGTQQYNLALSHRRADTVKAALVKDGVPASAIGERWFGKENPRVPTADGVREPQNRRVEISM